MKNRKLIYGTIIIYNLICIFFCMFSSVYIVLRADLLNPLRAAAAVSCIALIASLIYGIRMYKKSAAVFFKIYLWAFAVAQIASVFSNVLSDKTSTFVIIIIGLSAAMTIILAVVKDLGRRKSFIICGVIFAVHFVLLVLAVVSLIRFPDYANSGMGVLYLMRSFTELTLSAIAGIMIYAKYTDKAVRKNEFKLK